MSCSGSGGTTTTEQQSDNATRHHVLHSDDKVMCCVVASCPVNTKEGVYDRNLERPRGLEALLVGDDGRRCIVSGCHCSGSDRTLPVNAMAMWCSVCDALVCLDCIVRLQLATSPDGGHALQGDDGSAAETVAVAVENGDNLCRDGGATIAESA